MAWDEVYWELGYDEGHAMRQRGEPRPVFTPLNPRRSIGPEKRGILAGWDDADKNSQWNVWKRERAK